MKKVDVVKAYKKLPFEAQQQIDNILVDDKLKLKDVTIQYLIHDVQWTITRLGFDLDDFDEEDEEYQEALEDLKKCKKWMNYYKKYMTEEWEAVAK